MASKSFGLWLPFVHHLGIEMVEMKGGLSHLEWDTKPEHVNSFGVVHGGALMSLLDVTLATAARSDEPDYGVITIEMKTSFMQAARGKLTARGRLMHRSRSMAFSEGTIYDAEGKACAHATGTFKYVKRETGPVSTD